MSAYRICFVCLGNICRSPMAEVVMRDLLRAEGLDGQVDVASAGTGGWHVGDRADRRTVDVLSRRGYDARGHRARQFGPGDFAAYDLVVALDRDNLAALQEMAAQAERGKVRLLMSFAAEAEGADIDAADVPDPYYGGASGFDRALDLVERACAGLLEHVRAAVA